MAGQLDHLLEMTGQPHINFQVIPREVAVHPALKDAFFLLRFAGLDVFLDRWEVVGGSRLSQRLQQGLASADVVVLVVSAAAMGKQWWQEEFAAAMAGIVAGHQRLVPVLLDEVALPPFVAGRVYVDFRYVDAPAAYQARFAELGRAVRGLPAGDRPARGGGIVVPPGRYRAEGPRLTRLRIDQQRVEFSCADAKRSIPRAVMTAGLRVGVGRATGVVTSSG
jgi:TIR domain/Domain of unknown function (DUF5753)